MTNTRPTKKQRELLSFIQGFIVGHGYGPSYREIMRALNYKSVSTVAIHVDNLITKGHLRKRDHSARSLEVCNTPYESDSDSINIRNNNENEEKCLTTLIDRHFSKAEKTKISSKDINELKILINALRIIDLKDSADAFESRLKTILMKYKA